MDKYYPLNEKLAHTAWEMNHFGQYRSDTPEYMAEVDEAYSIADESAKRNPERKDEAYGIADRFSKRLAEWYNKKYRIDSMCPSILISGGGNFPVRKKQKQNQAWDSHYKELEKIKALKDRIRKIGTSSEIIRSDDDAAIDKLRAKIEKLTKRHEAMKTENAKARKEGRKAPFPPYSISNSNQQIRQTKSRLESLEKQKGQKSSERQIELMGESVLVIENVELMRLQLIFDGKPDDEIRTALKKNGFKWSPKNGAWQRQLTANARAALRFMIDHSAAYPITAAKV